MSGELRVVVLSYGEGGEYAALLDSLAREGVDRAQVLLVHNPSRRGERAPSPAGVEAITTSHNLGYAAAMNVGIERALAAAPELILLLTHDARLRPGALAAMTAAAAANPGYAALGPVLVYAGTEEPFSYGGVTDRHGRVGHRRQPEPGHDGVLDCSWLDGGTLLLRAAPLAALGGFDERLWSYFEDAELCLRLRRAGHGVAVVLAAVADQEPGGGKRPAPWAYLMTRNGLAYARAFAGARGAAALTLAHLRRVARELGIALARLARRRRRAAAVEPWALVVGRGRGIVDFLRGRWGPPPAGMPGGGDVTNVEPPGADG